MKLELPDSTRIYLEELLKDSRSTLVLFDEGIKSMNVNFTSPTEKTIRMMMNRCKEVGFLAALEHILEGREFTPFIGANDEGSTKNSRCRENLEEANG